VILLFSTAAIYLATQINQATEQVTEYDMPSALNTLAMLEELGDMNSNLLEYVLGEEEEQEYFGNYDEFTRFRELIPLTISHQNTLERVVRIVEGHRKDAQTRVFDVYDPQNERAAAEQINSLVRNIGNPLEKLLDELKDEEIADVGSAKNFDDVINDDLPGVRYYLELVDEAGDMLADLDRFVLGHVDARRSFFENALQFESFLVQLKPLEQKPSEIIKINEIERLFRELKSGGQNVFDQYQAKQKTDALESIDYLEHQSFKEAETLLDDLSNVSRKKVDASMRDLESLANNISIVLLFSTVLVISLTLIITLYTRKTIFIPLSQITTAIDKLRQGDRDFELKSFNRNDELNDIFVSLQEFKLELGELDNLRDNEDKMQTDLVIQRDTANDALNQLRDTQTKLVSTEKMASLGNLVAGVAHEVNTPLGVSVTMSTTLQRAIVKFIDNVKSGQLKRSALDSFEQESTESLKILVSSLEQASHLIHNFKQVAVDQTSSKRREFNLAETTNEIMSTLHHRVSRTKIRYQVEGSQNITMDSYPGPLGQVITNLFNNAMLHAFDGRESGEINIRFSMSTPTEVRILFSDNGLGVEDENLSKLFDPFYTTKLGKGGSGLGLNIVYSIVTNILGGSISVDSNIGTTFDIKLPLSAPYIKDNKQ